MIFFTVRFNKYVIIATLGSMKNYQILGFLLLITSMASMLPVTVNADINDYDNDGIDDAAELANGLDPFDDSDAALDRRLYVNIVDSGPELRNQPQVFASACQVVGCGKSGQPTANYHCCHAGNASMIRYSERQIIP